MVVAETRTDSNLSDESTLRWPNTISIKVFQANSVLLVMFIGSISKYTRVKHDIYAVVAGLQDVTVDIWVTLKPV